MSSVLLNYFPLEDFSLRAIFLESSKLQLSVTKLSHRS